MSAIFKEARDFGDDLLKSTLIQELSSLYGLEECFVVQELDGWGSSIRWRVSTTHKEELFLKEKPHYLADEEFEFHLRFHRYLREQNGPVVRLITNSNQKLSFVWQGRCFELQEWFDGKIMKCNLPKDSRQLGSLIASFLVVASGFEDKYMGEWGFPRNRSAAFPETGCEILNYTNHIDHKLLTLGKGNQHATSWIRNWIVKHADHIQRNNLPEQFIHGDPSGSNCLRNESGQCVLIDLDQAHWGYRLSDIAMAIAVVASMTWHPGDSPPYHIGEHWQSMHNDYFLQGFEKGSPLMDAEKECFADFLGLNLIRAFVNCLDLDEPSISPPDDLLAQVDTLINMLRSLA